jgi:hypothetical protein
MSGSNMSDQRPVHFRHDGDDFWMRVRSSTEVTPDFRVKEMLPTNLPAVDELSQLRAENEKLKGQLQYLLKINSGLAAALSKRY